MARNCDLERDGLTTFCIDDCCLEQVLAESNEALSHCLDTGLAAEHLLGEIHTRTNRHDLKITLTPAVQEAVIRIVEVVRWLKSANLFGMCILHIVLCLIRRLGEILLKLCLKKQSLYNCLWCHRILGLWSNTGTATLLLT